jgi:hypothetical protein
VLDYFVRSIWLRETEENSTGQVADYEIAIGMIDMLFAAQDATASALSFAVDVLYSTTPGREMVDKIRSFDEEEDKDACADYCEKVSPSEREQSSIPQWGFDDDT